MSTPTPPFSLTNTDEMATALADYLVDLLNDRAPRYCNLTAGTATAEQAARESAKKLMDSVRERMTPRAEKCFDRVSRAERRALDTFRWTLSGKNLKPYEVYSDQTAPASGRKLEELTCTVTLIASGGWGIDEDGFTVPASMVLKNCRCGIEATEGGFEAVATVPQ